MALLRLPALAAALLLVLLLGTACVTHAVAVTSSDFTLEEQVATLAFLHALKNANQYLGSSWSGSDFCSYSGVDCNAGIYTPSLTLSSTSCLMALELPELADGLDGSSVIFTGFIAAGTSNSDRFPAGTLPASWGRLTRLQKIRMNLGALSGTVPSAWSGLTNLTYLSLEDNELSGTLPSSWAALTSLVKMYMDHNTFTGSIPSEWGGMSSLALVQMMYNSFCGCIPATWLASTTLSGYFDALVTNSNCGTTNACQTTTSTTSTTSTTTSTTTTTTTTPTSTESPCAIPGCDTCADGSSTICSVCGKGQTMGVANTTCNVSGNSADVPLSTVLVAAVVALLSSVVLLM